MAHTQLPWWSRRLTGTFLHFPHSGFSHWTNVLVRRSDLYGCSGAISACTGGKLQAGLAGCLPETSSSNVPSSSSLTGTLALRVRLGEGAEVVVVIKSAITLLACGTGLRRPLCSMPGPTDGSNPPSYELSSPYSLSSWRPGRFLLRTFGAVVWLRSGEAVRPDLVSFPSKFSS